MGLNPVIRIAWGYDFLVAEDQEGLWVLGCISHGLSSSLRPTLVKAEGSSAGPLRSMAAHATGVIPIDYQGFVFSSGNNSYGQLGRTSGTHHSFSASKAFLSHAFGILWIQWLWGSKHAEILDQSSPIRGSAVCGSMIILAL